MPVQVALQEGMEPGPATGEVGDRLGLNFLPRFIGAPALVLPGPAIGPEVPAKEMAQLMGEGPILLFDPEIFVQQDAIQAIAGVLRPGPN